MLKQIITKKILRGEPTRPKNTLKVFPGVFSEEDKIEIPEGAAAFGGRQSILF